YHVAAYYAYPGESPTPEAPATAATRGELLTTWRDFGFGGTPQDVDFTTHVAIAYADVEPVSSCGVAPVVELTLSDSDVMTPTVLDTAPCHVLWKQMPTLHGHDARQHERLLRSRNRWATRRMAQLQLDPVDGAGAPRGGRHSDPARPSEPPRHDGRADRD